MATMLRKTRLFTPGPTPLLPAAQRAMAAADVHHRTAEYRALQQRVVADLKAFIGTRNDVILLAASGSGPSLWVPPIPCPTPTAPSTRRPALRPPAATI